jgi:hypothetical protein
VTTCKRAICRSPICDNYTPPPPPKYAVGDLVICPLVYEATTRIGKVTLVDPTGGLDEQPSYRVDLGHVTAWFNEDKLDACDGPHIEALRLERDLLRPYYKAQCGFLLRADNLSTVVRSPIEIERCIRALAVFDAERGGR